MGYVEANMKTAMEHILLLFHISFLYYLQVLLHASVLHVETQPNTSKGKKHFRSITDCTHLSSRSVILSYSKNQYMK